MDGATAFSGLSARQRAEALLDTGSFQPWEAAPFVAGAGRVHGKPVLVAFTDGHVRGGTIGVHEASLLATLTETASEGVFAGKGPVALMIGLDTGGVRVEEGPRALAATSAAGVGLARLTLLGIPVATVISGPRGCFGAPAVMAALPHHVLMTENAAWGLTGPKLIATVAERPQTEEDGRLATSAAARLANGDVTALLPDTVDAVARHVRGFVDSVPAGQGRRDLRHALADSARVSATLRQRFYDGNGRSLTGSPARRREVLEYSLHGLWKPSGDIHHAGLMHAALGTLGGDPAVAFVLDPESASGAGLGIEEAALVTEMLCAATAAGGPPAAILSFLFCQGHAVDPVQERFGLPRALAECLRAMVAARSLGHPIVSVLGGGTYGAAYLALAAPSHRVLALRGTSVAPMSPQVLQAFQALRGFKSGQEAEQQLAELIPGIRMVDRVIRLPRAIGEEVADLRASVHPDTEPRRCC